MDKRKSLLNVITSISFKLITMVTALVVKRMLIRSCGNDVNGLNALYVSIIGMLSVAELGIGSAITFCMYKPIVEGDEGQVAALYGLFRRCYRVIGGGILAAGLLLTPFLPYFARDYAQLDVNLYSGFVLMLISVVLTYLFSAKTSLLNAYKNNYITTAIHSGGIVLQHLLQILVLMGSHSFTAYLVCRIAAVCVQWGITELVTGKRYRAIFRRKEIVSEETKKKLFRSVKAMLMHKVGTMLVNTADSMIISICIGVVALGRYSNYAAIMTSLLGVLQMIFTSLTSVVGHMYVKEDKARSRAYCDGFHMLNFCIGCVFFLGYFAVIDDLVAMLFGAELIGKRSVSFVITLNGFVQYLRRSALMFRDATGTFYNDRWKPVAEGGTNIILSVLLVKSTGVTGVILATILTDLLICHIVEPYILYKHAFGQSPKRYYIRNYGMIVLFASAMAVMEWGRVMPRLRMVSFLANGTISVLLSAAVCVLVAAVCREEWKTLLCLFRRRKRHE